MKKILAMLLALVMVFALCACGQTAAPAAETPAAEAPAAEAPAAEAAGSVYYLNFKPEADEAWQALAATYTQQTGVPVKVVTAASGKYEETLTAELDKSEAPTLFQCNLSGIPTWGEFCYDMKDSAVYNELSSADYALSTEDGVVCSVGYCLESFGIITNTALLEQAGYSLADITDFASLKAVADDIHARAAELGFDAFAPAGLDSSSSWRFTGHLTNMPLYYEFRDDNVVVQPATIKGTYIPNYKDIWDLYITDSSVTGADLLTTTMEQCVGQFKEGKAVFYQNGTWELGGLKDAGMDLEKLVMIPMYCGVEGEENSGVCTGTENFWSVNNEADEEDIQATLDFLYWVVTSTEGTTMMRDAFGPCPFKSSLPSDNIFSQQANDYVAAGKYPVTWAFNFTPDTEEWRAPVLDALGKYTSAPGDATWADVVTAMVEGWSVQYQEQLAAQA